jgi:hypothetical protein
MKKLLITFLGFLTLGASLPASAGDDRQSDRLRNVELRNAKPAHMDKEAAPQAQALKSSTSEKSQQTDKDIRIDKMMKGCAEMISIR